MDVSTLMKLALSQNSVGTISKKTGVSTAQVAQIVTTMMPQLLQGASAQANGKDTATGFNAALDQHGKADTTDLGKFLGGVDMADGAKILQHLLGGKTSSSIAAASAQSGVSEANVKKILTMVAPMLLAILGQQKKKHGLGSLLLNAVMSNTADKIPNGKEIMGLVNMFLK